MKQPLPDDSLLLFVELKSWRHDDADLGGPVHRGEGKGDDVEKGHERGGEKKSRKEKEEVNSTYCKRISYARTRARVTRLILSFFLGVPKRHGHQHAAARGGR